MPTSPTEIAFWALGLFIVGSFGMAVAILKEISKSISQLNERVAVILERISSHDRLLDRHEHRLTKMEESRLRDD